LYAQIDIAGCEQESDKQRFKGDPHDLIVFDEGTDFLESQYRFIIGWNRSTDPKQRCRVIVASNPPTTAEGLWVVKYWGPWLDTTHPNPAKPGELRWFTTINGEDREVAGPGPHLIDGEPVYARSQLFNQLTFGLPMRSSVCCAVANARLDPTFLMAEVEIVATYELYNINRTRLENLIHRIFGPARLEIEIKDRFGQPIIPREWFLVPLFVIDEAIGKIRDGTIGSYTYDPNTASLQHLGHSIHLATGR
jgi:Meiotically up-regulated gene 113